MESRYSVFYSLSFCSRCFHPVVLSSSADVWTSSDPYIFDHSFDSGPRKTTTCVFNRLSRNH